MPASVVLASFLVILSGSAPDQRIRESVIAPSPVQKMFIEVLLDPLVVEYAESAGDAIPAGSVDPANDPSADTRDPIDKDAEPLDQIEPMFVDEVEMMTDADIVDTAPPANTEDFGIAADAAIIAEPQPAAVEQGPGIEYVPAPEPVLEPVECVEPVIVAEPIVENAEIIPLPLADAVAPVVDELATAAAALVVETPLVLDATEVSAPAGETDLTYGTVDEPVSGPNLESGEPVVAPIEEVAPAVVEDAGL
jgi:hypothetical protein